MRDCLPTVRRALADVIPVFVSTESLLTNSPITPSIDTVFRPLQFEIAQGNTYNDQGGRIVKSLIETFLCPVMLGMDNKGTFKTEPSGQ